MNFIKMQTNFVLLLIRLISQYFTIRQRKLNDDRIKCRTDNRRLAQWRVTWLIEHSTSHQLLWCIDSFVLRNPPLRQAAKRCSEIPSGFRYIARRLCRPKPFQGLRTSEGFAKCKTLRKASGRYVQV